jgi:D-cysteine desulfhydrase
MEITLFRQFPSLRAKLPHITLGQYPTPVQKIDRFARKFGFNSLWVKRDDLSGEDYGGNKVRKLEFLLADAKKRGKKILVAVGAAGSNYVTATGIYGKKLGFNVSAVLFHQPPTDYLKSNLLVNLSNGVELNLAPSMLLVPLTELRTIFKYGINRTLLTPPGGSSAFSTLGYVNAVFELKEQINSGILPEPDLIFVPLGTGGTMAGLVLGCKIAGLKTRVIGVRVVDRIIANSLAVKRYCNGCLKLLKKYIPELMGLKIKISDFTVLHNYFGKGYAHFTEEGVRAVKEFYELEGIKLEGTYTGKTLAGMMDIVKKSKLESKTILFWNTYNSRGMNKFIIENDYKKLPEKLQIYFTGETQKIFEQ